jgi:glycosyltransferase involved in cell wall biosynthesis
MNEVAVRIMYIQPAEGFGGAERQGVLHIRKLADLGFEVLPVVGPGRQICEALEQAGVSNYVFLEEFFCEQDRPLNALGWFTRNLGQVRIWQKMQGQLRRLAEEHKIDLIFTNRSFAWVVASPVAHALRLPIIWRGGSRTTKWTQHVSLRAFATIWPPDALICNCEAVRLQLASLVSCPSFVVPNGVDTGRFDPARARPRFREEMGIDAGTPVVGFAARPAPEKGMEFLAQVILQASRSVPSMRVLIGGEFGWRKVYEEMFARMKLDDRVSFLGHVPDVENLYASCDVVVLTSRSHSIEGSPNAVLEAMAMERPIVATRVGGLAEAVEHGVQGYLASHQDVTSFARYLVELLTDRELRVRMGAAGRATIQRKYSDSTVSARLAAVVRGVAARAAFRRRAPAPREVAGLDVD